MVTTERPQAQAQPVKLPWRIQKQAEGLLLDYPDNLAAFRDLYADRAQSGGYFDEGDGLQRHLLAWSDPTGNHAHVCEQDTTIRDLARKLVPVVLFRTALTVQAPVLARVLTAAFLDPHTSSSGAYVIAYTAHVRRDHVRPAKEAIVAAFARQLGLV